MAQRRSGSLTAALDLTEAALLVLREHFRREYPAATEEELDRLAGERMVELHANEFTDGPYRVRKVADLP